MLFISFIAIAIGVAGMLLLPQSASSIWPFTIIFIIIYIFYNVNYAMTWAMMDEGAIPERLSGSAAGLISTIGYLPEIFISLIAGSTLEKYPGVTGYRRYFIFVIVMMIIGTVFVAVWRTYLNKKAKNAK